MTKNDIWGTWYDWPFPINAYSYGYGSYKDLFDTVKGEASDVSKLTGYIFTIKDGVLELPTPGVAKDALAISVVENVLQVKFTNREGLQCIAKYTLQKERVQKAVYKDGLLQIFLEKDLPPPVQIRIE